MRVFFMRLYIPYYYVRIIIISSKRDFYNFTAYLMSVSHLIESLSIKNDHFWGIVQSSLAVKLQRVLIIINMQYVQLTLRLVVHEILGQLSKNKSIITIILLCNYSTSLSSRSCQHCYMILTHNFHTHIRKYT